MKANRTTARKRGVAVIAVAIAVIATGSMAQAQTSIDFWTWAPAETTLNQIIEKFEGENSDIDVRLTLLESTAYQDRLPLALASGDKIDVAAVQTSTMVNLVKDFLSPFSALYAQLGSSAIEEQLNASALAQARSLADDGDLYFAPMGMLGSVVAFYNVDLLDELGLEIPRTREDLAGFVSTIKEQRPDLLPISFTGANWFLDEIALTFAEQSSPGFFNSVRYEAGGSWDSDAYQQAFDAIVGLYRDDIFSRDTLDIDYGRVDRVLPAGTSGHVPAGQLGVGRPVGPLSRGERDPLGKRDRIRAAGGHRRWHPVDPLVH